MMKEKYKEMLLDAAETVLGIFGSGQDIIWQSQGQKMVDGIEKKQNQRYSSRSMWKMSLIPEIKFASK